MAHAEPPASTDTPTAEKTSKADASHSDVTSKAETPLAGNDSAETKVTHEEAAAAKDSVLSIAAGDGEKEKATEATEHHTHVEEKRTKHYEGSSRPHGKGKKVMHGPYRLLRLLPHASRPIMSRILKVDPRERATLEEIFNDPWFSNVPFCTRDAKNCTIKAPGHSHTIVCEEEAHLENYKH